jgi:septation ring formation regulator EzrA
MNKLIALQTLEKDFDKVKYNLQLSKQKLQSAKRFYTSDELEQSSKRSLGKEIDRLSEEIDSLYGQLMAIGATCDDLRFVITNSAEAPEEGLN